MCGFTTIFAYGENAPLIDKKELDRYRDFNKYTSDWFGSYRFLEVGRGRCFDCAFFYWRCRYCTNSKVDISYRLVARSQFPNYTGEG